MTQSKVPGPNLGSVTIGGTVVEKQDQPASTTATWTSATAANTALTNTTVTGYGTANVSIQVPSTVTAGVITLEVSDDGSVWYPSGAVRIDNALAENAISLASGGVALNRMYAVSVDAMTHIRARLSTVITGAGNVIVRIGLVAGGIEPYVANVAKKDNGRQQIHLSWAEMAGTAGVESALTNFTTGSRGGGALTPATSYTVSTGKTLRIQEIHLYIKATSTVLNWGHWRLRQAASGIANTSPVIWIAQLGHHSATVAGNEFANLAVSIPDGLEIAATQQVTFTWLTTANTCTVGLTLNGYEY